MRSLTIWQAMAIALEAGTAMAIGVIVGMLLGHIIDGRLGGDFPIFTIGGALVGLISGVVGLARIAQRLTTSKKD